MRQFQTSLGAHRILFIIALTLFSYGTLSIVASTLGSATAAAQDNKDGEEKKAEEGDGNDAGTANNPKSVFSWLTEALGALYITVFLLLSFTFVALFVMNVITARRDSVCPVGLVESFEACMVEQRYQEAYDMAKADESMLGNVLSAGLAKLSSGYAPAIEAMQEVGEEETMKMQHRLSYIALIGTISPMVGLFGTVHGMISSFYEIATAGATPDPADLAGGISRALLTTLIGLAIAIPAIAVFNVLRNRVDRLVLEVGVLSEGLMSRFQDKGKK